MGCGGSAPAAAVAPAETAKDATAVKTLDADYSKPLPGEAEAAAANAVKTECPHCHRGFIATAYEKHVPNCDKNPSKPAREVFDSAAARVEGTGAEEYLGKAADEPDLPSVWKDQSQQLREAAAAAKST